MKCPYCAEDIKDDAIVCRYCGRDFSFLGPVMARLRSIETELANLRAVIVALQSLPSTNPVRSLRLPSVSLRTSSIAAVILSSTGCVLFYWLGRFLEHSRPLLILSLTFPLIGGCGFGLITRGRYLLRYLVVGSLVGIIDFLGIGLVWSWQKHRGFLPDLHDWRLVVAILVYCGGQAILFGLAATFGDWTMGRFSGNRTAAPITERTATVLAQFISQPGCDVSRETEVWKNLLEYVKPLLTLIGTFVTGYFTYLAGKK